MELKINIRKYRQQRGWTLAELAERVNISTPHMSEVERGVKNLNNHLLVRISAALEVSPDKLLKDEREDDAWVSLLNLAEQLDSEDLKRLTLFAEGLASSRDSQQK